MRDLGLILIIRQKEDEAVTNPTYHWLNAPGICVYADELSTPISTNTVDPGLLRYINDLIKNELGPW